MDWLILYIVAGCVVGLFFYRALDSMMRKVPDKHGNTSVNELICSSANRNSSPENVLAVCGILKFSLVVVTLALWPIFAIVLLWMLTWML